MKKYLKFFAVLAVVAISASILVACGHSHDEFEGDFIAVRITANGTETPLADSDWAGAELEFDDDILTIIRGEQTITLGFDKHGDHFHFDKDGKTITLHSALGMGTASEMNYTNGQIIITLSVDGVNYRIFFDRVSE